MEAQGYHYAAFDLKGEPSSVIDKAFFIESQLLSCADESGGRIMKRRQFDVSFAYVFGPVTDQKTIDTAANTEVEKIEDAIITALKTDLIELDNVRWQHKTTSGYLLAQVSLTATYWRDV